MNTQHWTVRLNIDPETKELVLPFPQDLLNQMGWDFGDTLIWSDNFDGSFTIKKKDQE